MKLEDYLSPDEIAWCPGCGNVSILEALKQVLVEMRVEPWEIAFFSGIGQAAKLPHYLRCNLFNGLHGRALPAATGARLANRRLRVFVEGGDGDGYAEGLNHLVHAIRRNLDMVYLVHDNQVYGLTKGQFSPTSARGFRTGTSPLGALYPPLNPLALAVALDCSFVARGFSGEPDHLRWLIRQAVEHAGFALIDILQNCVSFNKVNTFAWYRQRVYRVNDDPAYSPADQRTAFTRSREFGDRIPIGIIYRSDRPALDDALSVSGSQPLIDRAIDWRRRAGLIDGFR
jgi:2-oxoglutarate ferredoxin oxidoreductase subunit beta